MSRSRPGQVLALAGDTLSQVYGCSRCLLDAAWALRERFSAGDSLYAALAIRAGEPLLTSDMRLARAASDTGLEVRKPV